MKLGYTDYLNCYPFYFHIVEEEKRKRHPEGKTEIP